MTSVVGRRAFTSPVAVPVLVDLQQEHLPEPCLLALSRAGAVIGSCRSSSTGAPDLPAGGPHAEGPRIRLLHLHHAVHEWIESFESYRKK